VETAEPQRNGNLEQQERRQHALAAAHPCQHLATEPHDLHGQVSTNKLTGTGAGQLRTKTGK